MQFLLSTLSWEYAQGQPLIIQADFKCFQLTEKVECWNQEGFSGYKFRPPEDLAHLREQVLFSFDI